MAATFFIVLCRGGGPLSLNLAGTGRPAVSEDEQGDHELAAF